MAQLEMENTHSALIEKHASVQGILAHTDTPHHRTLMVTSSSSSGSSHDLASSTLFF